MAIATFTRDLAAATGDREIAVLLPPGRGTPFPLEVHHRIRRDERSDYAATGRALGACVEAVSLQFDYDTWGGDQGEYVFDLVEALNVPAVATLHAIPRKPTPRQRTVLADLAASVDATVVMSQSAATLLKKGYGVDPRRLNVIPHGVPDLPMADTGRDQGEPWSRGAPGDPELRPPGPDQGPRADARGAPGRDRSQPRRDLRDRGRHAPRPAGSGRGSVSSDPGRSGQGAQARRPCPVRRRVRPPGRDDPLAAGRRHRRHALSGPGPNGLGHALVRDGRGPGHRLDAVRVRRRTPRRRARRPRPGTLARPRLRPRSTRSSGTTSSEPPSAARPTTTAARWSGRRSERSIARCSSASGPRPRSPDALRRWGSQRSTPDPFGIIARDGR